MALTPEDMPSAAVTPSVGNLVQAVATALLARQWMLATAESCTGGLIAAACTELAGSSAWFDRGWVTYSNAAKSECLGVPPVLIDAVGAVSLPVAEAMARGSVRHAAAQCAIAVTGIAGPTGGHPGKPVGTVCFGWACGDTVWSDQQWFAGDRQAVRAQAVHHALAGLLARISP